MGLCRIFDFLLEQLLEFDLMYVISFARLFMIICVWISQYATNLEKLSFCFVIYLLNIKKMIEHTGGVSLPVYGIFVSIKAHFKSEKMLARFRRCLLQKHPTKLLAFRTCRLFNFLLY